MYVCMYVYSGTPTVITDKADHVINVSNTGGLLQVTLSITVVDSPPSGLTYSEMTPVYEIDTVITVNVPSHIGINNSYLSLSLSI